MHCWTYSVCLFGSSSSVVQYLTLVCTKQHVSMAMHKINKVSTSALLLAFTFFSHCAIFKFWSFKYLLGSLLTNFFYVSIQNTLPTATWTVHLDLTPLLTCDTTHHLQFDHPLHVYLFWSYICLYILFVKLQFYIVFWLQGRFPAYLLGWYVHFLTWFSVFWKIWS